MKPAGPSPGRRSKGGGGLIEGETRGGGGGEKKKRREKGSKTCRMYGHPSSSIVSGGSSRSISSKTLLKNLKQCQTARLLIVQQLLH